MHRAKERPHITSSDKSERFFLPDSPSAPTPYEGQNHNISDKITPL